MPVTPLLLSAKLFPSSRSLHLLYVLRPALLIFLSVCFCFFRCRPRHYLLRKAFLIMLCKTGLHHPELFFLTLVPSVAFNTPYNPLSLLTGLCLILHCISVPRTIRAHSRQTTDTVKWINEGLVTARCYQLHFTLPVKQAGSVWLFSLELPARGHSLQRTQPELISGVSDTWFPNTPTTQEHQQTEL